MSDITSALNAHNDARHAAQGQKRPDLALDDALTNDAKKYAQFLAENKKFEHSGAQGQGENLFMSSGNASLLDGTRAWLAEKPNYHGEKIADGNFGSYGHYTQESFDACIPCIWPTTTKVGIAAAKASNGATYIVARYTPPGNWWGQTAYGTTNSSSKAFNAASVEETPAEPSSECSVADGDSMSNISQKLGVSLEDLTNRNPHIEGPEFVVRKGDVLAIPYKISDKLFGVQVS
ncbi:hypothetical protein DHEL01_v202938 [Diaporthe helianthi]|uniref:LysM domain-containing protein n=1 Tax=Diaporthe helianthi TaxID=158607 RepID=A0A2P5I821_DIAHE|nr:hypothetical protein DHEL01_v202938 [Diaporthe helianthi]